MACLKDAEVITPWICMISRLSSLFVGREMSRLGFGPGQFFFLTALFGEEGLSQDELSRRVGVDKSNTSRALAKLEEYRLIRRQSDPQNHRVKKVYLEPEALKIRRQFKKIQNRWNQELLRGFSEAEKRALLSAAKKMADNAEAVLCEGQPQELASRQSERKSA